MLRVYWGLAGSVGIQGPEGYRLHKGTFGLLGSVGDIRGLLGASGGVRVYWGGKWTGSPTTLGPSPGSEHSHWFPLGSDLPDQGQARAPFQGPITPTGFPQGVTYLTMAKLVTEMSSAGYYIHCLITYSYMQCKEMLYGLSSLQTNLCISLPHQSDILRHNGTHYEELLFS